MRRDGSLITDPGYDEKTKLWYRPSGDIELPPIGTTRKEAESALADLKFLIEECALIADVDWAVALAGCAHSGQNFAVGES